MRVFLDANVIVAVLNREYPHYDTCARCLSLAGKRPFQLIVSSLSLGIAFYFSEKRSGRLAAKKKIASLIDHLLISPCGEDESRRAVNENQADDFEDALQYYSALSAGCDVILSNNPSDYHFSKIPVRRPDDFLKMI